MIEVIWHGRGGQGAFTAARLLGAAASFADGRHALAFPSFGPERRGAPMRAFTKLSDHVIGDRSAVLAADYVIYLDDTLFGPNWEDELKPDATVLVNSTRSFDDTRVLAIDADGISSRVLGRPIPNTVFLGALAALCDCVSLEDVQQAVLHYMPEKLHEKNLVIVKAAMREMQQTLDAKAVCARNVRCGEPDRDGDAQAAGRACQDEEKGRCAPQAGDAVCVRRRAVSIPVLRSDVLDPSEFAHSTCYDAGYLTAKNAGWRNRRPVIDAAVCTGCLQCYLYCPDGTVFKTSSTSVQAPVAIDYDFCKGCGVCAKVCAFGAIAMKNEQDESEADVR